MAIGDCGLWSVDLWAHWLGYCPAIWLNDFLHWQSHHLSIWATSLAINFCLHVMNSSEMMRPVPFSSTWKTSIIGERSFRRIRQIPSVVIVLFKTTRTSVIWLEAYHPSEDIFGNWDVTGIRVWIPISPIRGPKDSWCLSILPGRYHLPKSRGCVEWILTFKKCIREIYTCIAIPALSLSFNVTGNALCRDLFQSK